MNTADTDRLENAMRGDEAGGDLELERIDGMLDKILQIQHPEKIATEIKEKSIKNKGQAFTVGLKQEDHVSLLETKRSSGITASDSSYLEIKAIIGSSSIFLTHMATPKENAYIEGFHSIEQRELVDPHPFSSFYEARRHIEKYVHWYNGRRKHGAIGFMTPIQKWAQGLSRKAVKALMKPWTSGLSTPDSVSLSAASSLYGLDKIGEPAYLCLEGDRGNDELALNHFEKSVQFIGG